MCDELVMKLDFDMVYREVTINGCIEKRIVVRVFEKFSYN